MSKVMIWLVCKVCGWEGYEHNLEDGKCPDCGKSNFHEMEVELCGTR